MELKDMKAWKKLWPTAIKFRVVANLLRLSGIILNSKSQDKISSDQIIYLNQSGLLWNSKKDIGRLIQRFKQAFEKYRRGFYFQAMDEAAEVLQEIYAISEVRDSDHFPSLLSPTWTVNIGQSIQIAYLLRAAKLGLVPDGPRSALIDFRQRPNSGVSPDRSGRVLEYLDLPLQSIYLDSQLKWHNTIMLAPFIEQYEMVRGIGKFMGQSELAHEVLRMSYFENNTDGFLQLRNEYIEWAQIFLKKEFGIDLDRDWFCALHIRRVNSSEDMKLSNPFNYWPAIEEITKRGGYVVNFGSHRWKMLERNSRVIDLSLESNLGLDSAKLHAFLIYASRFLITTHSGPRSLANALGKPTINVNLVSPALNFFATPYSLSIPKHFVHKGRNLTFREILNSRFAFSEAGMSDALIDGIEIIENSAEEIRHGVLDMLEQLELGCGNLHFNLTVDKIYAESKSISRGNFAPSFIAKMPSEYLD
jgi:putative glycosyltransferase (TIGR04372 family)